MLIKESTLRRIIREEARRALHEDDAAVPAPVAAPVAAPAPAKPPLTDPALIKTMVDKRLRFQLEGIKQDLIKIDETLAGTSTLRMDFTILTTGRVDQNTFNCRIDPDPGDSKANEIVKRILYTRFDPIATPYVIAERFMPL